MRLVLRRLRLIGLSALVTGLVVAIFGIASATIWRASDRVEAHLSPTTTAAVVIPDNILATLPGEVAVKITANKYREVDPAAWGGSSVTAAPSSAPTGEPSSAPGGLPSDAPSGAPGGSPTAAPSDSPADAPSDSPTAAPSAAPSAAGSQPLAAAPSSAASESATGSAVSGDGTADNNSGDGGDTPEIFAVWVPHYEAAAWLGEGAVTRVTGLANWEVLRTEIEGTEAGFPDPRNHDIWPSPIMKVGEINLSAADIVAGQELLLFTDGTHAAPEVEIIWPRTVNTPLLWPLLILGLLIAALGGATLVFVKQQRRIEQRRQRRRERRERRIRELEEAQTQVIPVTEKAKIVKSAPANESAHSASAASAASASAASAGSAPSAHSASAASAASAPSAASASAASAGSAPSAHSANAAPEPAENADGTESPAAVTPQPELQLDNRSDASNWRKRWGISPAATQSPEPAQEDSDE